jgi:hypothetical protein
MIANWSPSLWPNTGDWRHRSRADWRIRNLVIRIRLDEIGADGPVRPIRRDILPYINPEAGSGAGSPGAA